MFQRETPQQTAVANAAVLAQIEVIDRLIELDHEQLEESLNVVD